MITEDLYIAYFENLAVQHKVIRHTGKDVVEEQEVERKSFFYVPAEYDLREIEKQLKNGVSSPLLMLDCSEGTINGATSQRDDIQVQYTILQVVEAGDDDTIRQAREQCKTIGFQVAQRMLVDCRNKKLIMPGKTVQFSLNQIKYDPVGPMENKFYGYTFRTSMSCPFDFSVDGGTWLDIPAK